MTRSTQPSRPRGPHNTSGAAPYPDAVRVRKRFHPLDGQEVTVVGSQRRRGELNLIVRDPQQPDNLLMLPARDTSYAGEVGEAAEPLPVDTHGLRALLRLVTALQSREPEAE